MLRSLARSWRPQRSPLTAFLTATSPISRFTSAFAALLLLAMLTASAAPAEAQEHGLIEGTVTVELYNDPVFAGLAVSKPWSGSLVFYEECFGETYPHPSCRFDTDLDNGNVFSARWTGSLHVPTAALYTFDLTADDAARLFIDGDPVTDRGWNFSLPDDLPPPQTIFLTEGEHDFLLEYAQWVPFVASLELEWAGPGFGFEPVGTVEVTTVAGELLENGSFEDGLAAWSVGPSGSAVAPGGPCGDSHLSLGPGSAKTWQVVGPAGIEAGGIYTLEGYHRRLSDDPALVELAFLDATGSVVGSEIWPISAGPVFRHFELAGLAPSTTTQIQVAIKARRDTGTVDVDVDCLSLTSGGLDDLDDPAFSPRDMQAAVGGDITCSTGGDQPNRERCAVVVYARFFEVWPLARQITLGDVIGFVYYREMHTLFNLGEGPNAVIREAFFRNFWEIVDPHGLGTGVSPSDLVRFLGEKQGWFGLARLGEPDFGSSYVAQTIGVVDGPFRAAFDMYRDGLVTGRPFDWGNWARTKLGYDTIATGCVAGEPVPLLVHYCSEFASPPYDYYFAVVSKEQDLVLPPPDICPPSDPCPPPPGSCPANPVIETSCP